MEIVSLLWLMDSYVAVAVLCFLKAGKRRPIVSICNLICLFISPLTLQKKPNKSTKNIYYRESGEEALVSPL